MRCYDRRETGLVQSLSAVPMTEARSLGHGNLWAVPCAGSVRIGSLAPKDQSGHNVEVGQEEGGTGSREAHEKPGERWCWLELSQGP